MAVCIACIVEGHGEVEAVPILLRRLAERLAPGAMLSIPRPIRIAKSQLLRRGELERAVELAARLSGGVAGILILLDSDDDCPGELGPALLTRATQTRPDIPVAVVLAKREFEGWFLAAADSLAGYAGFSADLHAPADPEAIRGAKEWLGKRMEPGAPTRPQWISPSALPVWISIRPWPPPHLRNAGGRSDACWPEPCLAAANDQVLQRARHKNLPELALDRVRSWPSANRSTWRPCTSNRLRC